MVIPTYTPVYFNPIMYAVHPSAVRMKNIDAPMHDATVLKNNLASARASSTRIIHTAWSNRVGRPTRVIPVMFVFC